VLAALLVVQVVTGVTLALHYAPSSTTAWGSVFHIEERVVLGSFVRGLHAFGASAIVLGLAVHVLLLGLARRYQGPRRVNWVLGLMAVPLVAALGLTGYLLPWDQKGYWATQVAVGIVRGTPLVGDLGGTVLQGGPELGTLTLTRFYGLHAIVLPAALFALLALHLRVWRRQREAAQDAGVVPYWPGQATRDGLLALLALAGVAALAAGVGAGLEAPADPTSDYPPRPEWYFAPLRELLKHVPEPWGSVVLPGALLGAVGALPWIDGGRRPRAARLVLLLPLLGWVLLFAKTSLNDAADGDFQARRAVAREDAQLARRLARVGIPPGGAGEMVWTYPPRWGERLFVQHCQECHVVEGRGGPGGPHLTGYLGLPWLEGVIREPDAPRYFGHVESLVGAMPPLDQAHLGDLRAIATYVRSLDPSVVGLDPALVAAGREAYVAAECNACHKVEPGLADLGPNLAGYGGEDWLVRFLRDPGHELFYAEDNDMPAYGEELSEAELQALAAYLRTLDGDPHPEPESAANGAR
jgi:ubiquinol-cytochrome c reductase cytochrome b subunit